MLSVICFSKAPWKESFKIKENLTLIRKLSLKANRISGRRVIVLCVIVNRLLDSNGEGKGSNSNQKQVDQGNLFKKD